MISARHCLRIGGANTGLERFAFHPEEASSGYREAEIAVHGFGVESSDSEIYERNKHDLVRYAAALVGPADADDVVSNVMVRALGRRDFSELDDPRSFLFHEVLKESKSRARRRKGASSVDPGPPDALVARGLRPEVWETVQQLPIEHRAATFLFYWVELSVGETAKLMGRRPQTVRRYLRLARLRLKEVLDGQAV